MSVPRGLVEYFKDTRDSREIIRFFDALDSLRATDDTLSIEQVQGEIKTLRSKVTDLLSKIETLEAQGDGGIRAKAARANTAADEKLPLYRPGPRYAWDDFSFNFLNLASVGAGVPSLVNVNTTDRWAHEYTNEAVEGNEKRQAFGVQVGHGVLLNSELRFHVHFYTGSRVPLVDEYVRWEATVGVTNYGSALSTTVYTADCLIPAGTAAFTHLIGSIATITGSNVGPSSDVGGKIRRKSSHANDTYEASVYLIFGDPHGQITRRGTEGEFA